MTKDDAFWWFVQGFKQSGEGYNAEYPFHWDDDEIKDSLVTKFNKKWEK